jgi:hypothetical protein
MDWTRAEGMGKPLGSFNPCGCRSRSARIEYGFTVGDASGQMDGYQDADEIRGEGSSRKRRYGKSCQAAGSSVICDRMSQRNRGAAAEISGGDSKSRL